MTTDRAPGAPTLSRRHVVIGGVFAAASGLAFVRRPVVANPSLPRGTIDNWLPRDFAGWRFTRESGVVLPPPDSLSDRLYDNLVTRVYAKSGAQHAVMLLMAYNNRQDGMLQVHRPETCYPAGGFRLSATRRVQLAGEGGPAPASMFTATGADRVEQVLYWTRVGPEFPASWAQQRLAVMRANLAGETPDGLLVRASVIDSDARRALGVLAGFMADLHRAAPAPLRQILIGRPRASDA